MSIFTRLRKKKPRVCVVGIDGLPHSLVERFCEEGVTPYLAKLCKAQKPLRMKVTLPEISAVSWSSFMTGMGPGAHGIFGFVDLKPNSYEIYFTSFRDLKAPTIWDKLGERGKRSIVINQPGTYPARDIPGIIVSGFVAIELVKAVRPPSWIGRIRQLNYQIDIDTQRSRKDHKFLFQELDRTLQSRKRAVELLWEEEWDYFQVVVTGTDRLQHYLWSAIEDASHEYHEKALNYYRAVDEFVGEMHERYLKISGESGVGKNFFILSDHGFCGIEREVYMNSWLEENGYLHFDKEGEDVSLADVSERTLAFALDPGRVFIHRRGRFPKGCVSDEEAKELIEKLKRELESLEFNGKKVIRAVHQAEEIYVGPEVYRSADIILTPFDGFDLKASLGGDGVFDGTDLTGMHTWDDAFFWSSAPVNDDFDITSCASIVTSPLV